MEKRTVAKRSRGALLQNQPALDLAAEVGWNARVCGGAKLAPPQTEATAARRGAPGAA